MPRRLTALRRRRRSLPAVAVAGTCVLTGACVLAGAVPLGTGAAAAASAGRNDGVASSVCSTTDRTPESDGRPFRGAKIRRSADTTLVPQGAVTLTACLFNGMNATRATPQFGLSGVIATASPRTLARLTGELDAIPTAQPGAAYSCPSDDASEAILYFGYRSGAGDVVTVGMQGCKAVTNMAQQTTSYPDGAAIPRHLGLGAPVIGQIAKLAKPVTNLRWANVVGHLRLCGGPVAGRCYIENYDDDRVVVDAAGDPWIAMAQIEHGRFHFRVAASGTYTFGFYTGNTLVKRLRRRVSAGQTMRLVFPVAIP